MCICVYKLRILRYNENRTQKPLQIRMIPDLQGFVLGIWHYFALGPALTMLAGMSGYFLVKFSSNMAASLLACAS